MQSGGHVGCRVSIGDDDGMGVWEWDNVSLRVRLLSLLLAQ